MNQRLTRIAIAAVIAAGTLTATFAGAVRTAAPALADEWHGDRGSHDRDRHDRGWHGDRDWHGYRPVPARYGWHRDPYAYRGPRYFDRAHGYWRDRLGYWNPSGLYISFHF